MTLAALRPHTGDPRHPPALTELFLGSFRRDLLAFFPRAMFESVDRELALGGRAGPPNFSLRETPGGAALEVELFGTRHRIFDRDGTPFTAQDRRMMRAIGAVVDMRYYHLFQISSTLRLELYRGGSEDHYVAAFLEPSSYEPSSSRPSRIAATIQALRTAALSTYENHRVSTGALLVGPLDDPIHRRPPAAPDALPYGVELTGLKSVHRLCDGTRTLFLVDRAGCLAEIIDITRWAAETPAAEGPEVPCARAYHAHAQATLAGGHMCLVLSPNQEIKIFCEGSQVFAFAHGRWRILDAQSRFASWEAAVAEPELARVLFQAALDLAEVRQGGLFVVVSDPPAARGNLIAPHDLLSSSVQNGPPPELAPRDPLAKRALHYLARGRNATALDPPVLEALASLDGALVTDRAGQILAFGAILRHDTSDLPALTAAEGARTAAACVASRFGPVLKVSEDGFVSCYLNGARAWDL
ncbi:MAG TPA: hypothetical protein VGY53_08725 [Isosphaeraceae bacterium]|nr:hypothetical protein [Isosphaeraceae bacterium]